MSDSESYVWIKRWDDFQHYGKRRPIWIKNYTSLLSDDAYLSLSPHRRAMLHGLWLAFATSGRRLRDDTSTLSSRLNMRVTTPDLEALNHAGFIDILASNVLAQMLEVEVEVEKPKTIAATPPPSVGEPSPSLPQNWGNSRRRLRRSTSAGEPNEARATPATAASRRTGRPKSVLASPTASPSTSSATRFGASPATRGRSGRATTTCW